MDEEIQRIDDFAQDYFDNINIAKMVNDEVDSLFAAYVDSADFHRALVSAVTPAVADLVYPSPGFASSTSGMTDTKMLYVLTTNHHIYRYDGTDWVDTGVTYIEELPHEIFYGKLALGSVTAIRSENPGVYARVINVAFSDDARLICRDGQVRNISGLTWNLNYESTTSPYKYVVYDSALGDIVEIAHTNSNELRQSKYTVLFGSYLGRINQLGIEVNTPVMNTVPYSLTPASAIIRGHAYVRGVGDNKYQIYFDSQFRFYYLGSSVSLNGQLIELTQSASQFFIAYREDSVIATTFGGLRNTDFVFCHFYDGRAVYTPYPDNIFLNTFCVAEMSPYPVIPNYKWKLDYNRLGYEFRPSVPQDSTNIFLGDSWTEVRDENTYNCYVNPIGNEHNKVRTVEGTVAFQVVTKNASALNNKHILMIGDSITARGWLQDQITDINDTVFMYGTKQTTDGSGQYLCEAIPGWSTTECLGDESPFYNPSTHQFDFSYYWNRYFELERCDIVVIEFGLNESISATEFKNNIQTMIDSIKAYNSNIPVYVLTLERRVGGQTNRYTTNVLNYARQRMISLATLDLDDCTVIPVAFTLTDSMDYVFEDIPYTIEGVTYKGCRDNIHPSRSAFKPLANIISAYLCG